MSLLAHAVLCDRCCDEIDPLELADDVDAAEHFHPDCLAEELADRFDAQAALLPAGATS